MKIPGSVTLDLTISTLWSESDETILCFLLAAFFFLAPEAGLLKFLISSSKLQLELKYTDMNVYSPQTLFASQHIVTSHHVIKL